MVGGVVFIIWLMTGCGVNNFIVLAKDCTNIPQAQSHTIMYQVSSTNNQTLKSQIMTLYKTQHHFEHVTPSDDSAWASLFPRKMKLMHMEEESSSARWQAAYKQMKHPDVFAEASNFLKEVSLHKVRLEPGQTNLQYLMMLDPESMAWNFRKTAGLPTPGTPYGGWEEPNCELRGQFGII